MSRYFDLMQERESHDASTARPRGETLLPSSVNAPLDSDLPLLGPGGSPTAITRPQLHVPEPRNAISLRSITESGFRHPGRIAGITGAIMLATILAIVYIPRQYRATMQLLVLNPHEYAVVTNDPTQPAGTVGEFTEDDVHFQSELLRSRDVLDQASQQMGLADSPALVRDKAIDTLGRKLDVARVANSNLLNVSLTESSPRKATEALQAIASSFVSKEMALLRPQRRQLLAELVDKGQQELTAAQQEFAKFKSTTGITSLSEYEAALQRQLDDYATQSATLATKLAERNRRRSSPNRPAVSNPLVSSLDTKVRLAERGSVDAQKRAYVSQLNQLQEQSAEFARLQKRVIEAQRSLDDAVQRRDKAVVDDALDKQRILNVALAAKPSASSIPVQPRPLLYLALGLFTAMSLAIGLSAMGELKRSTVCSPAELEALTGFPTLAVVPKQSPEDRKQSKGHR